MAAFREHFLDKYFAYRRRYVEYFVAQAPQRATLAVASETARLAFMATGNALCALVFWALAFAAQRRFGLAAGTAAYAVLALLPTVFGALALRGLADAVRDRTRIAERVGFGERSHR